MISNIKNIIGTPVQENLETHYTQSRDLIRNLRESRFTGFLMVEFWQYEGYVIFDTGNVVQVSEFHHDQEYHGIPALIHIYNQLKKREGSISTFKVDPEWLPLLLVSMQSRAIRSEKSVGETAFKEFVETALQNTDYGFIRVQYGVDQATAHILILNNKVVRTVLRDKEGKQSREDSAGRLFSLVMKMCSTIQTTVFLESSNALEAYAEGQKISEFFDLIEASDAFLELLQIYKGLMEPYLSSEDISERFTRFWEESCVQHQVSQVRIHEGRLEGLENMNLSEFSMVVHTFIEKLKPELDAMLSHGSFTEQLMELFWKMNLSNLQHVMMGNTADAEK